MHGFFISLSNRNIKQMSNEPIQKWHVQKWHERHCEDRRCRHVIGFTNEIAVIFGGTFIQQPRTNLQCQKCKRINVFRSPSDDKILRFVTETEIAEIIESGLDINNLFFKPELV